MPSNNDATPRDVSPYQLFVLALSIAALLSLAARATWEPDPEARTAPRQRRRCRLRVLLYRLPYQSLLRAEATGLPGHLGLDRPAVQHPGNRHPALGPRGPHLPNSSRAPCGEGDAGARLGGRGAPGSRASSWRRFCSRCCCSSSRRSRCSSSKRAAMETSGMPRTRCGGPSPR